MTLGKKFTRWVKNSLFFYVTISAAFDPFLVGLGIFFIGFFWVLSSEPRCIILLFYRQQCCPFTRNNSCVNSFYCRRHFSYTDLKHIKSKINSICIYLSSLESVPVDITFFLKHFFLVKSLKKRELSVTSGFHWCQRHIKGRRIELYPLYRSHLLI